MLMSHLTPPPGPETETPAMPKIRLTNLAAEFSAEARDGLAVVELEIGGMRIRATLSPADAAALARALLAAAGEPDHAAEMLYVCEGVLVCLKCPRGSEAQVRCLEEVGQDAERAIAAVKGAAPDA
jgi:hypothetical protein